MVIVVIKHSLFPRFSILAFGLLALTPILSINAQEQENKYHDLFTTSEDCIACHSGMVGPNGEDISIGYAWRASMMGNAARDPYWMAGVRREIMDHPQAQAAIEDKCSVCHMPMARTEAIANGGTGVIFDHLNGVSDAVTQKHAKDGVSCTVCHQIKSDNFGQESSFDGGYMLDVNPLNERQIYGPFEIDEGRKRIMQSATNFSPGEGAHIQQSELCATCHTLFTTALDDQGQEVGVFPEQMPYMEWLNSEYKGSQSCQSCHMPVVDGPAPITSVLGEPREAVSQHVFRGGNAFMLNILNKYRDELGVTALPEELETAAARTIEHLETSTANISIENVERAGSQLGFTIAIENLAGHKFPSAYPSRRVWLHVTVVGESGNVIFESGAMNSDGSINGNDNDEDGSRFEPHYTEITRSDQVQIYETVIFDYQDQVTTSLLSALVYAKDNRLLPRGFDKGGADDSVKVRGQAAEDENFDAAGDSIRYSIDLSDGEPVRISAKLYFQTIGYRWATNLKSYNADETNRFVGYYEDNANESAIMVSEVYVSFDP
jgi:hypothetical protein